MPRTNGPKDTPERRDKILQALRAGNTRGASCAYAGLSADTFALMLKRHSEFSEAVKEAEASAEVRHVANIAKAAKLGNWTASAWWLERRRHEDWGRKDRVEIISTVRELARANGLTDEETDAAILEAERYLKEMRGAGRR
jgi:hypothetical protein